MTTLHQLFEQAGQSPWIDNLQRSYLEGKELVHLVDQGIRGVTSNPTIFANAIENSQDYDDQFKALIGKNLSVEQAYWEMVIDDISHALEVLDPLYKQSKGQDGFVSLEVSPSLAHKTQETIDSATDLKSKISGPNLLIKIPATKAGIPAIKQMISQGCGINVTLIFSLQRYEEVIEAFISGLESLPNNQDLSAIASVASFFVSRVDTEIDKRLDEIASSEPSKAQKAQSLKGKAALAQAKLAYQIFKTKFSSTRWQSLSQRGASVQRPLWASTSTKNPNYPDLIYVENLIGPNTVNTMPEKTVNAFLEHGKVSQTIEDDLDLAHKTLEELGEIGIDLEQVTQLLEDQGVDSFTKSFDELIDKLTEKAAQLS